MIQKQKKKKKDGEGQNRMVWFEAVGLLMMKKNKERRLL